jgi:hypothetical protein
MGTCLIIANETLAGEQLLGEIADRIKRGSTQFYVVVPVAPITHRLTWDEDESRAAAQERLAVILAWLRNHGAEAGGELGDRDPIAAARDALREHPAEEIILSTLPLGISRWIGQDVPSRLRGAIPLPVTVVTATSKAAEVLP